jgi:hypothetical protein
MNNFLTIPAENRIVATPWRQLCNSLLHDWHFWINREVS